MLKSIKSFFKKDFKSLNQIIVLEKNLLHNISILKMLNIDSHIFPVIKSNAYGFWLKQVLEVLNKTDIHSVCVDSFIEYQIVRDYSDKKVLLLWETYNENYKNFSFSKTSFCVYNLKTIKYLISLNKKIKIHLFLNTWMNREWIDEKDLNKILKILSKSKLIVEGVCSHFSSADEKNNKVLNIQIDKFKNLYKIIKKAWFNPEYRHISASAGALKINDSFFNACRPWIAFYWYNPLQIWDKSYNIWNKLKPALELYSTVVSIHEVEKEEWVSYNSTYKVDKKTKVATIPFWYYEWLNRKFSNNLQVKCNWKYYPIRWNICMNYLIFEIWKASIKVWDKVQIISSNKRDKTSISNLAKLSNTISYEIITWLNSNINRKKV